LDSLVAQLLASGGAACTRALLVASPERLERWPDRFEARLGWLHEQGVSLWVCLDGRNTLHEVVRTDARGGNQVRLRTVLSRVGHCLEISLGHRFYTTVANRLDRRLVAMAEHRSGRAPIALDRDWAAHLVGCFSGRAMATLGGSPHPL
jgi:hypothetical protein